MSDSNNIDALRDTLFATLRAVKDGSLDLEKAKAVNQLAKTIVDTAKVEVAYLKTTGGGESSFINSAIGSNNLPPGITGVTRHRLT